MLSRPNPFSSLGLRNDCAGPCSQSGDDGKKVPRPGKVWVGSRGEVKGTETLLSGLKKGEVGDKIEGVKQVLVVARSVKAVFMLGGDLRVRLSLHASSVVAVVSLEESGLVVVVGMSSAEMGDMLLGLWRLDTVVDAPSSAIESFRACPLLFFAPRWCFNLNFSSQPGLLVGLMAWLSGPEMEAK